MDFMMKNLLSFAAGETLPKREPVSELDLSWRKNHSCERFIDQEDLRPASLVSDSDMEATSTDEMSQRVSPPSGYSHFKHHSRITSTPDSKSFQSSGDYLHFSSPSMHELSKPINQFQLPEVDLKQKSACFNVNIKQEVTSYSEEPAQKKPHPFSVEALLGTDTCKSDGFADPSKPAQISSTYMSLVSSNLYSAFCPVSPVQQPRTSTPLQNRFSPTSYMFDHAPEHAQSNIAYWCHVCNELCVDKTDATKHQMIHRMQNAKCNLRRLLFNEHGYITKHTQDNSLERMKCGLCDKVVASCFFTKHQRIHDGHVCTVCEHEFATNSRLQDHMSVHTGSASFTCTTCYRKFNKRSSLIQHQRYHREYRKFKCSFCDKCFNSKYACAVHERLHTGENPFKCTIPGCDRAFPQKIQLRLHNNSHHNNSSFSW